MSYDLSINYNDTEISSVSGADSSAIVYNGSTIVNSFTGTKTLSCSGKLMNGSVIVGPKTLNCSGQLMNGNIVVTSTQSEEYISVTYTFTSLDVYTNNFHNDGGSYFSPSISGGVLLCQTTTYDKDGSIYWKIPDGKTEIIEAEVKCKQARTTTSNTYSGPYVYVSGTGGHIKYGYWREGSNNPWMTDNDIINTTRNISFVRDQLNGTGALGYEGTALSWDTYYTIKFVKNSSNQWSVYKDGTLLYTASYTSPPNMTNFRIGMVTGWYNNYARGYIEYVTLKYK